jgi:flavin reductase (DIM6/NTAB) family NADH-FMN oxidoreductase RutF
MCEPTTIMLAASTVLGAYGASQQAGAQKSQLQYSAAVADNNAKIAGWQANDALRRGEEEAARVGREASQVKGAQRARQAAAGLDLSVGTAKELQDQTDFFGQVDQATVRDNAAREAWSIRQKGNQYTSDAGMSRASARQISPGLAATTSLISGGARVADRWYS